MDDARRARRMGIAIRLVLYPMALGLIVLAWQHYHGDSSEAEPIHVVEWSGVTSQGKAMHASSADGRLLVFDTTVLARCSDGSPFAFRWNPAVNRFTQHGEDLRGRAEATVNTASGDSVEYDNRVSARMDDHPHGTIRVQLDWTRNDGTVACDSGPVTFDLRR
jgi:hypothetical protein